MVHAYPEIGFNENKFPVVTSNFLFIFYYYVFLFFSKLIEILEYYWKDKSNRRKLMIEYASAKKFDALVPTNWYSVTFRDLVKWKVNKIKYKNYIKI